MNDNSDETYDAMSLDNSYQDEMFNDAVEEAERARENISTHTAQAKGFAEFVEDLTAVSETYESVVTEPQNYDLDSQLNHNSVAHSVDGLFIGTVGAVHMMQQAGQAVTDYRESYMNEMIEMEPDPDLEAENQLYEEVLENDLASYEDENFALDSDLIDSSEDDFTEDDY